MPKREVVERQWPVLKLHAASRDEVALQPLLPGQGQITNRLNSS
jgi:hypothetical protein